MGIETCVGLRQQAAPDAAIVATAMEAMVAEAVLAERAGFHSIRVPDRHGRTDCYFPGSLQLLSLLARETSRVAIGAFALPTTLYSPMLVAEQCAVIDNLSRGRLFMAWSRGKDYWSFFGVSEDRLLRRFIETLEVLETSLRGERFSHHGEFYDVDDALLTPRSYQTPRFPFWGGGNVPASIARCARYAEAWGCNDSPFTPEQWDEHAGAYREAAEVHGKRPFIVLMRNGWVAASKEQAVAEFGTEQVAQIQAKIAGGRARANLPFQSASAVTVDAVAEHLVIGTAADCIERLEYYEEELGVDYVTMRFRLPDGRPFEAVRDQIERFGDEVVAHFHRRPNTAPDHPAIPSGARW